MCESKRFSIKDDLTCVGDGAISVARKIVAKIAQEILYGQESTAAVENAERRDGYETALKRTSVMLGRGKPAAEVSVTGFDAGKKTMTDAEIVASEADSVWWRKVMWSVVSFLESTKTATAEYHFESMHELLMGNAWLAAQLPTWLDTDFIESPGSVNSLWKTSCDWLNTQLRTHWRRVTNFENSQVIWADQEARDREEMLSKMSKKERARLALMEEKRALAEQLKSLGIAGEDLGFAAGASKTEVEIDRELKATQAADERRVLETYDASLRALYSVYGMRIQSGMHKLCIDFQGLDIFDLLPEPPPVPAKHLPKPRPAA